MLGATRHSNCKLSHLVEIGACPFNERVEEESRKKNNSKKGNNNLFGKSKYRQTDRHAHMRIYILHTNTSTYLDIVSKCSKIWSKWEIWVQIFYLHSVRRKFTDQIKMESVKYQSLWKASGLVFENRKPLFLFVR